MKFQIEFLYKQPKGFDLPMVLLITFATAFYITFKLDVKWHVTHDNKEIKGKDRFLNEKELKNCSIPSLLMIWKAQKKAVSY